MALHRLAKKSNMQALVLREEGEGGRMELP